MNQSDKQNDWTSQLLQLRQTRHELTTHAMLGEALRQTRQFLSESPADAMSAQLEEIENDYRLMSNFMRKGYQDNQRGELYDTLINKLYRLLLDIDLDYRMRNNPQLLPLIRHKNMAQIDATLIREKLEGYVYDVALSSLEPEANRAGHLRQTHENHHRYQQQLFEQLLFARQWSHDLATQMADIISSPAIDSSDAQLMTSALTLAACYSPDVEKLLVLLTVYRQAADEHVRQRALVGWAFATDNDMLTHFPEARRAVERVLEDERTRKELLELQMQVVYCRNAKRDNDILRQDIMPTLLKNQHLDLSQPGDGSTDEDALNDILHPEADDQRMEELEGSIRKMMDMRDRGADIYFSGFSQMKRFSFFYTLCNWFLPFSTDHPQLQHLETGFMQSGLVKHILGGGSFCDSDKYSFVLATASIYHKLPANILEMMNSGQLVAGMPDSSQMNTADPLYIRRMYLQDLYRFFTLCDYSSPLINLFDNKHFLFLCNNVYLARMGHESRRMQRFLLKQQMHASASRLLFAYKEADNIDDMRMEAHLYMHEGKTLHAQAVYARICDMQPDNLRAIWGYAQSSLQLGDYEEAEQAYTTLYNHQPDSQPVALNLAVSQINNGHAAEGVKLLYKLVYTNPDDTAVKRALAWGKLWIGESEQAEQLYATLIAGNDAVADDYLHAGYCAWFANRVEQAAMLIRQAVDREEKKMSSAREMYERFGEDAALLLKYGVGTVEQKILSEMVFSDISAS